MEVFEVSMQVRPIPTEGNRQLVGLADITDIGPDSLLAGILPVV
jgi:hypothetical protein